MALSDAVCLSVCLSSVHVHGAVAGVTVLQIGQRRIAISVLRVTLMCLELLTTRRVRAADL